MVEHYNVYLNNPSEGYVEFEPVELNFEVLSQREEGLSNIKSEDIMTMAYDRDNIHDIAYAFSFVENTKFFQKIIYENAKSFDKIHTSSKEEIVKLANTFKNIRTSPVEIYELSKIGANEKGTFIAYINQSDYLSNQSDQKLHIMWKNAEDKELKFIDELIKKTELSNKDFPDYLRTFGYIETTIEHKSGGEGDYYKEWEALNVKFSGKSSNKEMHYAPKLLDNSYSEIIEIFAKENSGKQIILEFEPPLEQKKHLNVEQKRKDPQI